jgi:hypothetical protein
VFVSIGKVVPVHAVWSEGIVPPVLTLALGGGGHLHVPGELPPGQEPPVHPSTLVVGG